MYCSFFMKEEQPSPRKITVSFPVIFHHGAGYGEVKLGNLTRRYEEKITGEMIARDTAVTTGNDSERRCSYYRKTDRKFWALQFLRQGLLFHLVNLIWSKISR
jgi:hypothetical protein